MNARRRALASFLAVMGGAPALALGAERTRTVGYLSAQADGSEIVRALAAYGHFAGRNLRFEVRYARPGLADAAAAELARLRPDALVAFGSERTRALRRATTTIPIVTGRLEDPVGDGLARSLARPGYNVTGLSFGNGPTGRMLCVLLRRVLPGVSRLVWIGYDGASVEHVSFAAGAREAGVTVAWLQVADADEGERAMARLDPAADVVGLAPWLPDRDLDRLIRRAASWRLATAGVYAHIPESGGLLSFAQRYADPIDRVAALLDKVLRGADPADIPFEMPDRTELVVNARTARSLGIALPDDLLLRATKVIG